MASPAVDSATVAEIVAAEAIGPMLIGVFLNIWLYGMVLMQAQTYFKENSKDQSWVKMIVVWLVLLDTVNSVFNCAFTYDYTITKFGDLQAIARATLLSAFEPILTVMISTTVQCFFAWRVYRLTHIRTLALFIVFCALGQLVVGTLGGYCIYHLVEYSKFTRMKFLPTIWLTLAPVTDCLIAGSLVWHLRKQKTGFDKTDHFVDRLNRIALQTGLITSITAILELILFFEVKSNLHFIPNMALAKLYTNSLLSSLNARRYWASSGTPNDFSQHAAKSTEIPTGTAVQVTTQTGVHIHHEEFELGPHSPSAFSFVHNDKNRLSRISQRVSQRVVNDGLSFKSDTADGSLVDIEARGAPMVPEGLETEEERCDFKVSVEEVESQAQTTNVRLTLDGSPLKQ